MMYPIQDKSVFITVCEVILGFTGHGQRTIENLNNPKRFMAVLSPDNLKVLNDELEDQAMGRMAKVLPLEHNDSIRLMDREINFNVAEFPEDKIGVFPMENIRAFDQDQIVWVDYHPWLYTRILETGDTFGPFDFFPFVTIASLMEENNFTIVQKDFLFRVERTGCRWRIIQEPKHSPYDISVCVYEPDYYQYIFDVMDFDTALRFAGDHASDKIRWTIEQTTKKLLHPWKES